MPRERRDFVRRSGFRDASLVVIACEGAATEPDYFEGLRAYSHNPRLHVEVLQREDPTHSSPAHVLQSLNDFATVYHIRDGDRLWLVADRDAWTDQMLSGVAAECGQRRYDLAVSNPCFELWLLLHFEDVPGSTDERRAELLANTGGLLKRLVAARRQPYMTDFDICATSLQDAISRGRALDTNPADRWPQGLGTHVYRLVDDLRKRGEGSGRGGVGAER